MNEDEKRLEEFKEAGLEYRYREQLMVQEFGFTIVVAGLMLNFLLSSSITMPIQLVFQVLGFLFVAVVSQHLAHINQDRSAALDRREALRVTLKFEPIHRGASGRRSSVPRFMVWVARAFAAG